MSPSASMANCSFRTCRIACATSSGAISNASRSDADLYSEWPPPFLSVCRWLHLRFGPIAVRFDEGDKVFEGLLLWDVALDALLALIE